MSDFIVYFIYFIYEVYMAKYTVPKINFTEIDNSIRTVSEPGIGIGAIVIKSNKGPVNMRTVSRNYGEFKEIFGPPEALDDYGHFAAENYLANSNQLYAVRATMGDEQYSQIQYAFPNASSKGQNLSPDTAVFKYVDNEGLYDLKLTQPLSAVTLVDALIANDKSKDIPEDERQEWIIDDVTYSGFSLKQEANWAVISDIKTEKTESIVYKKGPNNIVEKGIHVVYPTLVDISANPLKLDTTLMITNEAWEKNANLTFRDITVSNSKMNDKTVFPDDTGVKVSFTIPSTDTMDSANHRVQFVGEYSAVSAWADPDKTTTEIAYSAIFKSNNFYVPSAFTALNEITVDEEEFNTNGYGKLNCQKLELLDWDDVSVKKTYYIDSDFVDEKTEKGQAHGLYFREYGREDDTYTLIGEHAFTLDEPTEDDPVGLIYCKPFEAMYVDTNQPTVPTSTGDKPIDTRTCKKICFDMANEYGLSNVSDILSYFYLRYFDIKENVVVEKIIREEINQEEKNADHIEDDLFWLYSEKDSNKTTIVSVFKADSPELAQLPIQEDYEYTETVKVNDNSDETYEEVTRVNPIVAQPSSYLFNSVDKTYADGYTLETSTEDEPGNGDIEHYQSNFDGQFVIASLGPGKYGNDIGVSIITAECSEIPALNHRNAFNWKWKYDDEDQVKDDSEGWNENSMDLTWKKVFRINVYAKTPSQTAKLAWGTGMEALTKDPIEYFLVSLDPYAKDAEGNSLYAPTVVNGHSDYIYISRASAAIAKAGSVYQQPKQTYAIYQLTGGKNSQKNEIKEKTAALSLYRDVNLADIDILFNCEAIESFGARAPKYIAHQRTIGQIAADRTMDIGVIQVTAKDDKTVKQMVADGKQFSFNNGTYVAMYGGYDKYYNGDVGAWIYLPKSVAGACVMAYCDNYVATWMAPAGVQRGQITYTHGQLKRLTDNEIGELYENNINTSKNCGPAYGECLYGQKTALKKLSSLNRINVRRCLNFIEKNLKYALEPYLFQQNTPNTRASAKNVIDSFLNRVKAGEGILAYSTSVTEDKDDPHIMNVSIKVLPAEAIEFIDVKIFIEKDKSMVIEE